MFLRGQPTMMAGLALIRATIHMAKPDRTNVRETQAPGGGFEDCDGYRVVPQNDAWRARLSEIAGNNVQIGLGGKVAVKGGIDHAPTCLDDGVIPEIVCGFQNDPGRIHRSIGLRLIGTFAQALA
jgi:hypothetical protein